ncbi:tyrosine-type recombinase/integrase [Novosphingobium rosa]|uniref:hypothetical protein n=1 Tax=Novosphingobium rosa TaxID=76978 RepID=UPI0012EEA6D8|nr:hypothetical protein [Novosphingobium rosa]
MTVSRAHQLYIEAVLDGRASRAKRIKKPRTIKDKRKIFDLDIAPKIGKRSICEITEDDLVKLVNDKGKTAKVRANRLAAELKVFFGWAAGLRGREIGLKIDPSKQLGDLKFPEKPRTRKLSQDEIAWYLKGVAQEKCLTIRRGLLLLLLTAVRIPKPVTAITSNIFAGPCAGSPLWDPAHGQGEDATCRFVPINGLVHAIGTSFMATTPHFGVTVSIAGSSPKSEAA